MHSAITLSERANFAGGSISARLVLAWVYLSLGDREAAEQVGQALAGQMALREDFGAQLLIWQAYQALADGQPARAKALLARVGGSFMQGDSEFYYAPMVYVLHLEIALANGEPDRALELAREYQARMRAGDTYLLMPDLLRLQGRALQALGRFAQAGDLFQQAYAAARRQGSRRSLVQILRDLVRWMEAWEAARMEAQKAASPEVPSGLPDLDSLRAEAREVVDFVAGQISDPRLREAFLANCRI
jgi:ATP/maltotriose-dependent transcriptional regulator MalT